MLIAVTRRTRVHTHAPAPRARAVALATYTMFAAIGPLSTSLGLVGNAKKAVDVSTELIGQGDALKAKCDEEKAAAIAQAKAEKAEAAAAAKAEATAKAAAAKAEAAQKAAADAEAKASAAKPVDVSDGGSGEAGSAD